MQKMNEDREKAMVTIINFFNSRMGAMSKNNVDKAKELISTHEIAASDICPCGACDVLVWKYDDYGLIWNFCQQCHWWYIDND
jgi:hypothetical protein